MLAAIESSKTFLAGLSPEQIGRDIETPYTMDLGVASNTMPIEQWLTGFATTNLYFHLSIAYAIFRSHGVPIGKRDLLAGGF